MKDRKNIDRIYQEKFKDFEATPKEAIWNNINEKLEAKKRKKIVVLPLWYRIAGAAAALALLFSIGYFTTGGYNFSSTPQVVFDINKKEFPQPEIPSINPHFEEASNLLDEIIRNNSVTSRENQKNRSFSTNNRQNFAANAEDSKEEAEINNTYSEDNANRRLAENISSYSIEEDAPGNKTPEHLNAAKKSLLTQQLLNDAGIATEELEQAAEEEPQNLLAALEKEKNTTPDDINSEKNGSRLHISTFAAPVYYDNLGSGSSIDPQFANNTSQGKITMSYGINMAYAISDKVKIRTGLGRVSMGYETGNIAYNAAINPNTIASIDYHGNNYEIRSASGLANSPNFDIHSEYAGSSTSVIGAIDQNFAFIEVPLEMEYNLLDKKIGINLIGGGSSLFLDENRISLSANNQHTELGEANNLNNISFSTNIGLGFDYNLSSNFQFNLEPIFKYQINTFRNVEDVQPYYFGIYSGLSFKF